MDLFFFIFELLLCMRVCDTLLQEGNFIFNMQFLIIVWILFFLALSVFRSINQPINQSIILVLCLLYQCINVILLNENCERQIRVAYEFLNSTCMCVHDKYVVDCVTNSYTWRHLSWNVFVHDSNLALMRYRWGLLQFFIYLAFFLFNYFLHLYNEYETYNLVFLFKFYFSLDSTKPWKLAGASSKIHVVHIRWSKKKRGRKRKTVK